MSSTARRLDVPRGGGLVNSSTRHECEKGWSTARRAMGRGSLVDAPEEESSVDGRTTERRAHQQLDAPRVRQGLVDGSTRHGEEAWSTRHGELSYLRQNPERG